MLKTCSKCKAEKDCSEFSKDAAKKDGLRSSCRECWSEYNKARRSSKEAKEKAAAYAAEHYSKPENKARHAAHMAGYFRRNRDAYAARGYRWRLNPENAAKVRAYNSRPDVKLATNARVSAWSKANPDARRASFYNRLAMKKRAGGKHTAADIKQLFRLQRGKCACCHVGIADGYHVDHIQPLALGGSNDKTNLQLLCPTCNLRKSAKHPVDFMRETGRLL
jgi:5-methylcytosine-specific restriction endonuclease McrA